MGKEFTKDAYQHFTYLVKLLEELPEVTACAISVLQEGVRIPIHTGYYKGIMRYMMPIIVPKDRENVFLCVNEKKYNWTEGEGVLWDDNFPHKVYNNTNEIRVVIFMDVIRPLCGIANYLNKQFINLISNTKIISAASTADVVNASLPASAASVITIASSAPMESALRTASVARSGPIEIIVMVWPLPSPAS